MRQKRPIPTVRFRCVRETGKAGTPNEVVEEYSLRVDGCHGLPEALDNVMRLGHEMVGYDNLDTPKYASLRNYCDMRLGKFLHTRLRDQSVMGAKIEEAKGEQKRRA